MHGMTLPTFISQPPPHGPPLLNEQENDHMQNFFSSMAADGTLPGHQMMEDQFYNMSQPPQLPNTYVGHDSFMQPQHATNWNIQHMSSHHQYGQGMDQMPTSPFTGNGHLISPINPVYQGQRHFPINQQQIHPRFNAGWQQSFQQQPVTRAEMQFGSDPHFMNTGYAAPDGIVEQDLSILTYAMQPTSSASNTQPNSASGSNANTEPSSPATNKKRKLNKFEHESLRMTPHNNGKVRSAVESLSTGSRRVRKSYINDQPPTPVSKTPTAHEEDDDDAAHELDGDYERDEDMENLEESGSATTSKSRHAHKNSTSSKAANPTKKSMSTPSGAGRKAIRRQSTGPIGANSRTPLTAEQKKANHTNSEQRRRDATSKAYAELYDLVPETEEGGKQSTMKKMGVVVDKVKGVTDRLSYLQQLLSQDHGKLNHMGPWG